MAQDGLYVNRRNYNDRTVYYHFSLVPHQYVAAMADVFPMFWSIFSFQLFCDGIKRKNRKQAA